MMTWDYRVFREQDGAYVIREVFYDDDGSLLACTESAVEPMGESLNELAKDIDAFKEALKLPVLTLADIPSRPKKKGNENRGRNLTSEQLRAKLGLSTPPRNHRRAPQKNGAKRTGGISKKKKGNQVRVR